MGLHRGFVYGETQVFLEGHGCFNGLRNGPAAANQTCTSQKPHQQPMKIKCKSSGNRVEIEWKSSEN